jgi:TPR repeat protein
MLLISAVMQIGLSVAQRPPPPPSEAPPEVITDEVRIIAMGWALESEQVKDYAKAAMEGGADAALKLALHFTSGLESNPSLSDYWMLIAAENGSAIAQYNIGYSYRRSNSLCLRHRAVFWLKKAAAQGVENAVHELEKIAPSVDLGELSALGSCGVGLNSDPEHPD